MRKSIEQVMALAPTEVSQVYTGIDNICRCGCGGDYYSTSYHKAPRSEVNDAKVAKLLQRAKKLIGEGVAYELGNGYINVPTHDQSKRGKAICIYWDELKDKIQITFSYEGAEHSIAITPTDSDWWTGTEQFDIHYCEEYNEICVYPIGSTDAVHVQAINPEVNAIDKAVQSSNPF